MSAPQDGRSRFSSLESGISSGSSSMLRPHDVRSNSSSRPPSVASKVSPRPGTSQSRDSLYSSSINIGSAESRSALAVAAGMCSDAPGTPDFAPQPPPSAPPPHSAATKRRIRRSRSKSIKTEKLPKSAERTGKASVSPRETKTEPDRKQPLLRRAGSRRSRRKSHCKGTSSLLQLDDPLLLHIVSFLSSHDRLNLARVDARLADVCKRMGALRSRSPKAKPKAKQQNLVPDEQKSPKKLSRRKSFLRRMSEVQSFHMSVDGAELPQLPDGHGYVEQHRLQQMLQAADTLQELDLSNEHVHSSQLQLLAGARFRQLTRLLLAGCFDQEPSPDPALAKLLGSVADTLEELDLSMNTTVTGKCLGSTGARLQCLLLNGCTGLQEEYVEQAALCCSRLHCLQANNVRADLTPLLTSNAGTLTRLELNYYESGVAPDLLRDMTQLQHFEMANTYSLTQELIDALAEHCRLLEVLRIGGKEAAIGRLKLARCKHFTQLRVLDVGFWQHLPDGELNGLTGHGRLEDVNVHNCDRLTASALLRCVRNNVRLRQLCITECERIDTGFVKYAADLCKAQLDRTAPLTLLIGSPSGRDPSVDGFNNHNFCVEKVRQWRFD